MVTGVQIPAAHTRAQEVHTEVQVAPEVRVFQGVQAVCQEAPVQAAVHREPQAPPDQAVVAREVVEGN